MPFVCILGEVNISYIFCFIFRDLLTFSHELPNSMKIVHDLAYGFDPKIIMKVVFKESGILRAGNYIISYAIEVPLGLAA